MVFFVGRWFWDDGDCIVVRERVLFFGFFDY